MFTVNYVTCNLAYYCLAIALVIYKYKFAVFWRWFIINREKNDTTLHERIILYNFSWCLIELITFTSLICKGVLEFSGFTFYISPSSVDYQFYIEFKSFRSSLDLILLWPRFSDSNCAHFSPHVTIPLSLSQTRQSRCWARDQLKNNTNHDPNMMNSIWINIPIND